MFEADNGELAVKLYVLYLVVFFTKVYTFIKVLIVYTSALIVF